MVRSGGSIRSGDLRHRVTIQNRGPDDQDDFGEPIPTWTDEAAVWGHVRALSGKERGDASGLEATVDHMVTIRYRGALNATKRLVYNSRVFEIKSILVDEVDSRIDVTCTEQIDG